MRNNINEILDLIANHQISPEEGLKTIKELQENPSFQAFETAHSSKSTVLYEPKWVLEEIEAPSKVSSSIGPILIFDHEEQVSRAFKNTLGVEVILVKQGSSFKLMDQHVYEIQPSVYEDYVKLILELKAQNIFPSTLIHLWSRNSLAYEESELTTQIDQGIYSLYYLFQAVAHESRHIQLDGLYCYPLKDGGEPQFAAVSGFLKTLKQEIPLLHLKVVESSQLNDPTEVNETFIKRLYAELVEKKSVEVRLDKERRFIKKIVELDQIPIQEIEAKESLPKEQGVYLITGGLGGLGYIFAEYLAQKAKVKLVLSGRSALNHDAEEKIKRLQQWGAEILYIQSDLSNKEDVFHMVSEAVERFSRLDGILHCAGIIQDSFFINKTKTMIRNVLAPKVYGTLWLDEATKNLSLDFLCLFSSVSSEMGNIGQCDYAYANSFMDHFARLRETKRMSGKRAGKTISINWPLWADGGMRLSEKEMEVSQQLLPFHLLPTSEGLANFEKVLNINKPQVIVLHGDRDKISGFINPTLEVERKVKASLEVNERIHLLELTEQKLIEIFSEILKLAAHKIDSYTSFKEYGVDSIAIKHFGLKMEGLVGPLPTTLLYEYKTIHDLAQYLIDYYADPLIQLFNQNGQMNMDRQNKPISDEEVSQTNFKSGHIVLTEHNNKSESDKQGSLKQVEEHNVQVGDIAIIGVGGRYPDAQNLEEFWENLKQGKSAISDIPKERWSYQKYYDSDPLKASEGKIYCKQGAFIKDVDKFDPYFFNITPFEAKMMSPEERLLLEVTWETLESSGNSVSSFSHSNVGVYIGVTSMSYPLLGIGEWESQDRTPVNTTSFTLANRISYMYNLKGISLTIDTACSSSSVAVHMACESIRRGECEAAIAGGVNLYLHPSKYLSMCQNRMVSSREGVKMLAKDGDGFTPGEGVGTILLKPLSKAIEDKDVIYGIIKGSGVKHKGSSNGFFLPDPASQSSLMSEVLEKSNIHPQTVSYIEAQALGSETVDYIEWSSINKVYQMGEAHTCAIGSIKPNIGHLESSSGISQITKILLQMKHKQIVPSLVDERVNPNIRMDHSSFYLPEQLIDWEQPIYIDRHGMKRKGPRRAALNSFGAGGTEVHMIIEEPNLQEVTPSELDEELDTQKSKAEVILLSAKTKEQLALYVESIRNYLVYQEKNTKSTDLVSLADLAYTLQNGRDHWNERLAILAETMDEVITALTTYLQHERNTAHVLVGTVQQSATRLASREAKVRYEEMDEAQVAHLWIQGVPIEWERLTINKAKKIYLPSIPFEKHSCWMFDKAHIGINTMISNEEEKLTTENRRKDEEVVASYYDTALSFYEKKSEDGGYLTFAPFTEKIEGFSWVRVFAEPEKYQEWASYSLAKQKELRNVLYRMVNFQKVHHVLDIGCGFSTDIIELAKEYPHIQLDGYTISPNQVEFGQNRLTKEGLHDRVQLFCKDSSVDPFPRIYDLIIGFEVTVHIENKQGVFGNISKSLAQNGQLILADCLANTVNEVHLPQLGQYTSTQEQYSRILSKNRLKLVECVDVGKEIANFLYDPQFENHLENISSRFPELTSLEKEHRGWNNFGRALEMELFRYVLLTIEKAQPYETEEELFLINQQRFTQSLPYTRVIESKPELGFGQVMNEQQSKAVTNKGQPKVSKAELLRKTQGKIISIISEALEMDVNRIDVDKAFADFGVDSLIGLKVLDVINRTFELSIKIESMFSYSTIRELSHYLAQTYENQLVEKLGLSKELPKKADQQSMDAVSTQVLRQPALSTQTQSSSSITPSTSLKDVAVIGVAGRFPGADDTFSFWDKIKNGVDTVIEVPKDRWNANLFYDPDPYAPGKTYSKWGGFLEDVDKFDPFFFKISPTEAEVMDPQQRLFLQECWRALEDAGYTPQSLNSKKCGVYAGVFNNEYSTIVDQIGSEQSAHMMTGNSNSILASRIAYLLNLRGPAITVDTACSSSLVAVHLACRSLQNNETEMMLAGGVTLYLTEKSYISMSKAGMLSKEGKCKAFDNEADGIVPAEGVGVVVLKLLDKAIADGDFIYGVIKGSEINQDGKTNGITAPNAQSQTDLQLTVYEKFGINPETISLVEAHGTGTKLGDPIEIAALTEAFRQYTDKKQYCAVGSIKSNLGHTSAASGVISLIKVLLSLQNGQIPPTLHVAADNEHIDFAESPFYLNKKLTEWPRVNGTRRAAINSFGFSGTNCHVIVEEPPVLVKDKSNSAEPAIFTLSAKNEERLKKYANDVLRFIEKVQDGEMEQKFQQMTLSDVCYTFQVGRLPMEERLALVVSGIDELKDKLFNYCNGNEEVHDLYLGQVSVAQKNQYDLLIEGEEGQLFISSIIQNKKLAKLAQLWVAGIELNWELLYTDKSPQRYPMPAYPFHKKRYWVGDKSSKPNTESVKDTEVVKPKDESIIERLEVTTKAISEESQQGIYYTPRWTQVRNKLVPNSVHTLLTQNKVLIIMTDKIRTLVDEFKKELCEVYGETEIIEITLGSQTQRLSRNSWQIDVQDPLALQACSTEIGEVKEIYYFGALETESIELGHLEVSQERGVLTFFRLCKMLKQQGQFEKLMKIKILTNNVYQPLHNQEMNPFGASLQGLARSLVKEYPQISISTIDVDRKDIQETSTKESFRYVIKSILSEEAHKKGEVIALRKGKRYMRNLLPIEIPENQSVPFRKNGVYMLIGGMGTIGYDFASHLAETVEARLVIVGRTKLDEEKERKLRKLTALGGECLYIQADVTNKEQMEQTILKAKMKFGKIHGVVHSAIHFYPEQIETMDESTLVATLAPKVKGSVVLSQVLEEEALDFMLFFSSAQAFTGNAGRGHYAASIEFKDAYAHYLNQKLPYPVKIINWGFWGTRRGEYLPELEQIIKQQGAFPLTKQDGMRTIDAIISHDLYQIVTLKVKEYILELMGIDKTNTLKLAKGENFSLIEKIHDLNTPILMEKENQEAQKEFNDFVKCLLLNAFHKMRVFDESGKVYSIVDLKRELKIVPQYEKLFDSLLNILESGNFVKVNGGYVSTEQFTHLQQTRLMKLEEEKVELSKQFPDLSAHIQLLWTCLNSFPDLLTGKAKATDIMFPQSSMDLVENVYKGNKSADYFNHLAAFALEAYIQEKLPLLHPYEKIRIVEVGAGTGGTSEQMLQVLHKYRTQILYSYTDISKAFTQYGKMKYGKEYPFVEFKQLNIERDIESQGFELGSYDVVIAANVLHATKRIKDTLIHVKSLLKRNGLLILNEATEVQDGLTLTFGLLDGWWLYEDEELRLPDSPLLSVSQWENLLMELGFNRVHPLGESSIRGKELPQHIILAESNGEIQRLKRKNSETEPEIESSKVVTFINNDTGDKPKKENHLDYVNKNNGVKEIEIEEESSSLVEPLTLKEKREYIEGVLIESITTVLQMEADELNPELPLMDLGIDSILATTIVKDINEQLGIEITPTTLFDYSTVDQLTNYLAKEYGMSIFSEATMKRNHVETPKQFTHLDQVAVTYDSEEEKLMELFKKLEERELSIEEVSLLIEEV